MERSDNGVRESDEEMCNVRNIPQATNVASADTLITSRLFWNAQADLRGEQAG